MTYYTFMNEFNSITSQVLSTDEDCNQIQDFPKMFCISALTALLFLSHTAATKSPPQCSSVISNTCLQRCNSTACHCDSNGGKFQECNQACHADACEKVTCSADTCIQSCHGCQMECTSGVDYCNQRCLSGTCVTKCNAKKCVQNCKAGKCTHVRSIDDRSRPIIPRRYLAVLAGLFGATAILSFIGLVLACRNVYRTRQTKNGYSQLNTAYECEENIYVAPTFV